MKKMILFLVLTSAFVSCKRNSDLAENRVTQRILYDVAIINKDQDFDWWVQNIEGAKREELISDIFSAIVSGKVKAYDYITHKPMAKDEINSLLKHTDTISFESPQPPYEIIDSIIITELNKKDIEKLRFMEEWYMDKNTLAFNKKVVGICPMIAKYGNNSEFRGYMPLFWVFFDERYPEAIK